MPGGELRYANLLTHSCTLCSSSIDGWMVGHDGAVVDGGDKLRGGGAEQEFSMHYYNSPSAQRSSAIVIYGLSIFLTMVTPSSSHLAQRERSEAKSDL